MATILLDPQAVDLMLPRVPGSSLSVAPRAAVVNAQPRPHLGQPMPGHAADVAMCAWLEQTEQDRGADRAKRVIPGTAQGGRFAGIGGAYVTSTFSTRTGPPSCSSPA